MIDNRLSHASAPRETQFAVQACLNVPAALLAFVDSTCLGRAACVARAWQAAAKTPALWTHLAAARWPCTASRPLADVVRARGPRDFFRAFVAAERPILPTFAPPPPPTWSHTEGTTDWTTTLAGFNDLLFTIEIRQGDRVLCSMARDPFDVLSKSFEADYVAAEVREFDGFIFDGLNASVDCRAGWFPPGMEWRDSSDAEIILSLCVVRISDGHVSRLLPPTPIDEDNTMGYCALGEEANHSPGDRFFAANSRLSGGLPTYFEPPHQLGIRPPFDHPSWRGAMMNCIIAIGNMTEFPNAMHPEIWSPAADPSLVVQADGYVLIRRISIYFMNGPNVTDEEEEALFDQGGDQYAAVDMAALVRSLEVNLEFR